MGKGKAEKDFLRLLPPLHQEVEDAGQLVIVIVNVAIGKGVIVQVKLKLLRISLGLREALLGAAADLVQKFHQADEFAGTQTVQRFIPELYDMCGMETEADEVLVLQQTKGPGCVSKRQKNYMRRI